MREYYHEISYGNFSVDGDAGGWYNSSSTMQQAVDNTREVALLDAENVPSATASILDARRIASVPLPSSGA